MAIRCQIFTVISSDISPYIKSFLGQSSRCENRDNPIYIVQHLAGEVRTLRLSIGRAASATCRHRDRWLSLPDASECMFERVCFPRLCASFCGGDGDPIEGVKDHLYISGWRRDQAWKDSRHHVIPCQT
jgi:hypothetical protein